MKTIKSAPAVLAGLLAASSLIAPAFALNLEARDGHTSAGCFTYEADNKAWAHLINPYNEVSLYNPPNAQSIADDTKDLIIQFTVTGVQEEFTIFPGFQVYGDNEDDGEELSIWSQDTYKSVSGSEYTYKIDQDGSYELVVPFKALADGSIDKGDIDEWGENLDKVGILELCFSGVGNDDLTGFKHEGFSVEFTGIVESNKSRLVEECAFNGGEPVKFSDDSQSGAETAETPAVTTEEAAETTISQSNEDHSTTAATGGSSSTATTSETQSSSSSASDPALIIIIVCVCVIVVIAVIVIVVKKKKK